MGKHVLFSVGSYNLPFHFFMFSFVHHVLLVVGIGGLIGAMHEIKIERDAQLFHSEYE